MTPEKSLLKEKWYFCLRIRYAEADSLFLQIVTEFPDSYMTDDALMKAALLEHHQLKARESAKKHYELLIDQYPTSLYTAQAKKNYRKL